MTPDFATSPPVGRIARPPVPDAEKLTLLPLRLFLSALHDQITPAVHDQIQAQFAPYLTTATHPALVTNALIELLCTTSLINTPRPVAERHIGRLVLTEYRNSILGRVLVGMLTHVPHETLLRRLPRDYAAFSNYGTRSITPLAPTHWRFTCEDEIVPPDYMAGMLEAGNDVIRLPNLRITPQALAPHSFAFDLHWDEGK